MADPYVGEIRIFAGTYAPRDWAFCDGTTVNIQQYTALFSIIGFQFGGDGRTNFKLPDLRGQAAMCMGAGPGLTPRPFAKGGGNAQVTLLQTQMPNHTHAANAQTTANQTAPAGNVWANSPGRVGPNVYADPPNTPMSPLALSPMGGDQPHNNIQPYLAMNFIIALQGVYPSKP